MCCPCPWLPNTFFPCSSRLIFCRPCACQLRHAIATACAWTHALQHVGTEANVAEHICDTGAFWSTFHSLDHCQTLWMDQASSPAVFSVQLSLSQFLLRKPAMTVFLGFVTSCQPEVVGSSLLWPDHAVHTPHCVARLTLTHGICSLLRWQTHRRQSSGEAIRQLRVRGGGSAARWVAQSLNFYFMILWLSPTIEW